MNCESCKVPHGKKETKRKKNRTIRRQVRVRDEERWRAKRDTDTTTEEEEEETTGCVPFAEQGGYASLLLVDDDRPTDRLRAHLAVIGCGNIDQPSAIVD